MVYQVFQAQKLSPVRNDWCNKIVDDLKYCSIDLSESEIRSMSKIKFKSLLTSKIYEVACEYLLSLKNKHSKSEGLSYNNKINDYLITSQLTTEEKQLLFQLRTRSFDCKANFKNKYNNQLACSICNMEDSQMHLLNCKQTTTDIHMKGVKYSDIFGTTEQQIKIAKVLMQIVKNRKILLRKSSNFGSQVHP